ncbi:MAG: hypothetical protein E4H40_01880 [Candidatus Brocadiia bacterium]|nr:MAG: hypothetical protein E4H40_01880 [Candidatus Brocadiia bacterium]
MMCAPKYKLNNLTAIIDYNKLSLSDATDDVMSLEPLIDKAKAFRWNTFECNGHSVKELVEAFEWAKNTKNEKPNLIIAHTIKGKGVSYLEGKQECHAVSMPLDKVITTLKELNCPQDEIDALVARIKEKK